MFVENKKNYKVLTPNGWESFKGIINKGYQSITKIEFESGEFLRSSHRHRIMSDKRRFKMVKNFKVGDKALTKDNRVITVKNIILEQSEDVFDIVGVDNGSMYLTNGIISHNCEFISESDTLIDPIKLAVMRGIRPSFKTSKVRWYHKPQPNKTYLVGLDPSMGTGGDYAAIQVFQLPEFIQVAEWQHNKTAIPGQVKVMKEILEYLHDTMVESGKQIGDPEIYWTLENNSIGESANIVVADTGEEKFCGTFMNEPRKTRGKKTRRGFFTTNRSKLEACAKFKNYIEQDKMIIYSMPLISELKNFVSRGASYSAKSREHDDLISACLLIVRLAEQIKMFDDDFEKHLSLTIDDDDEEPLPISVLSTF